ncbi:hypothetical protein EJ04DRAFT_110210 [Polyplosphaeria fusca]|uniref:Heterokaryon incompatibility domain-containing protein n=1 Tax=Polyplosphaeria fusca TaxID=682080 RepID=A0A9P4QMI4_9PLEO|nr:hypothetical protein EJ04DRAFT_110210 [Polyplosphaeria fusca]
MYEANRFSPTIFNAAVILLLSRLTSSLHSALCHFRLTDRSRFIWIDGVCIYSNRSPINYS